MAERDILDEMREAANGLEDVPVEDIEALLRRAIETIETLRVLVGIREEIELEDAPPAGRA